MTDPIIALAGMTYAIPLLAIKQNRHVEPLAAKNRDYFIGIYNAGGKVNPLDLTEQQAEDFTRIVYYALTRAAPDLTYAQFEAMPISMKDIIAALPTCIMQTGLYKPAAEATPQTGEAQPPLTGTDS
jgi:hypothetical protein